MSEAPNATAAAPPNEPSPTAHRPRFRLAGWVMPLVVSLLIVLWQADFHFMLPPQHEGESITASSGLLPDLRYFFYFYYHLGLFPVGAREVPRLGSSKQDALNFVARYGSKLRMDFGEIENTPRFGDYGKLFTLIPDALLSGDAAQPTARTFNQVLFIGALLAVWWAFWRERRVLLGAAIVLLMGSNPFQLYETYGRGNIFSLPISVALLALAAHLPYLTGRRGFDRRAWITALVSGVVLATFREIRTEPALIAATVIGTYLSTRATWPRRLALVLVFFAAWGVTSNAWSAYWSRGFERAAKFVEKAGGVVFAGQHSLNHEIWHAVYCGLGDFGRDRGFDWDDTVAFKWATTKDPVTNPNPLPYHYREGEYYFEETWDGVNRIAPTDLPAYNHLVRDRFVNIVRADPLWYSRILLQRAGAILGRATPASFTIGVVRYRVPGVGWLLPPMLLLVCLLRRAFETKLILFTLPLVATSLLIYSGGGTTNYGIAHLLALAVGLDLLVRAWRARAGDGRENGR